MLKLPSSISLVKVLVAVSLNLNTFDILDQVNLCPVPCRMFSSVSGLYPLEASSTIWGPTHDKQMAPDIAECPLEAKLPLVENHCFAGLYFNHYFHVWKERGKMAILQLKQRMWSNAVLIKTVFQQFKVHSCSAYNPTNQLVDNITNFKIAQQGSLYLSKFFMLLFALNLGLPKCLNIQQL